ncbi:MAG: hypothetical protein B0A82_06340 [Alkalinema sp. CACIAM 70d]|nr:MAG: hypothetical protein B0A82_06340 [Alkalinema sp. CACIAM 70d]
MQDTRLNRLLGNASGQIEQWFRNPWRRISLLLLCLLLGFFLGSAVSTTAGQAAEYDIWVAAILVLLTELASRTVYTRNAQWRRSLLADCVNGLKIGFTYSLFVEALKLGS